MVYRFIGYRPCAYRKMKGLHVEGFYIERFHMTGAARGFRVPGLGFALEIEGLQAGRHEHRSTQQSAECCVHRLQLLTLQIQ